MNRSQQEPWQQLLWAAPWMRALPQELRDDVVARSYETTHQPRELIAAANHEVHSWIGVGEGLVKVVKPLQSGKAVRFPNVPPGSWIEEASIASRSPRQYDIVAICRTRILHVPAETFRDLLEASHEFNAFIIGQLSERLGQFMSMVEADRIANPIRRLARVIAGAYNPVLYPNSPQDLHFSQEELGELAGLTRQRTNQAVKSLERAGALTVRYGGLLVKDLAALRRMGEQEPDCRAPMRFQAPSAL